MTALSAGDRVVLVSRSQRQHRGTILWANVDRERAMVTWDDGLTSGVSTRGLRRESDTLLVDFPTSAA